MPAAMRPAIAPATTTPRTGLVPVQSFVAIVRIGRSVRAAGLLGLHRAGRKTRALAMAIAITSPPSRVVSELVLLLGEPPYKEG